MAKAESRISKVVSKIRGRLRDSLGNDLYSRYSSCNLRNNFNSQIDKLILNIKDIALSDLKREVKEATIEMHIDNFKTAAILVFGDECDKVVDSTLFSMKNYIDGIFSYEIKEFGLIEYEEYVTGSIWKKLVLKPESKKEVNALVKGIEKGERKVAIVDYETLQKLEQMVKRMFDRTEWR